MIGEAFAILEIKTINFICSSYLSFIIVNVEINYNLKKEVFSQNLKTWVTNICS